MENGKFAACKRGINLPWIEGRQQEADIVGRSLARQAVPRLAARRFLSLSVVPAATSQSRSIHEPRALPWNRLRHTLITDANGIIGSIAVSNSRAPSDTRKPLAYSLPEKRRTRGKEGQDACMRRTDLSSLIFTFFLHSTYICT